MRRIASHIGVLLWLALLSGLAIRSHLTADERWGFSMFGDIRLFRLTWEWVDRNGIGTPFSVRGYLRGDARLLSVSKDEGGEWAIGPGALRTEVRHFAQWLYENEAPFAATSVRCTVEMSEWRVAPWTTEVIVWPEGDGEW